MRKETEELVLRLFGNATDIPVSLVSLDDLTTDFILEELEKLVQAEHVIRWGIIAAMRILSDRGITAKDLFAYFRRKKKLTYPWLRANRISNMLDEFARHDVLVHQITPPDVYLQIFKSSLPMEEKKGILTVMVSSAFAAETVKEIVGSLVLLKRKEKELPVDVVEKIRELRERFESEGSHQGFEGPSDRESEDGLGGGRDNSL